MRDDVEVAIIGGGLAGSALASVLARRGIRVRLCDLHASYPPDFRAEKLTARQMALLARLGLDRSVRRATTPIRQLAVARFGRIVERRPNDEHGFDYAALVNAIREGVPPSDRSVGRAARIEASDHAQTVVLGDGTVIPARLVVIATGLGRGLIEGLGIRKVVVQAEHCLTLGFDLKAARMPAGDTSLTCYGDGSDRSAYLTLFPIGDRLRANLFLYRHRRDDWVRAFKETPTEMLGAMMPDLAAMIGAFEVRGPTVVRPIELTASEGHVRDGVVLVGDAFSTTCPTGGTGIDKVLTDVDRLAAYIPAWLATPGMSRGKIAQFYADSAKAACDANARRMIDYARSMALDPGLVWSARRYRNYYAQILRDWMRQHLARRAA